jgi:hypothetical protein
MLRRLVATFELALSVAMTTNRMWSGSPVAHPSVLLHPATDYGHRHWASVLDGAAGSTVIDATAGNGHDTLALVRALARAGGGTLCAVDVQPIALERTRDRLRSELGVAGWHIDEGADTWRLELPPATVDLRWALGDHQEVLRSVAPESVRLVVFNLGYLPGTDKSVVTTAPGTVRALEQAEAALCPGGCLSVALYPGHPEGVEEEGAVLDHASQLPQERWSVHHTSWLNQRSKRNGRRAPSLVLIQRVHDRYE